MKQDTMGKDKHSRMKITPDSGYRLALSRHLSRTLTHHPRNIMRRGEADPGRAQHSLFPSEQTDIT